MKYMELRPAKFGVPSKPRSARNGDYDSDFDWDDRQELGLRDFRLMRRQFDDIRVTDFAVDAEDSSRLN
jgi:hypothetical protein